LKLGHDERVGPGYAQLIAAWKKAFPAGDTEWNEDVRGWSLAMQIGDCFRPFDQSLNH